MIGPNFSFTPEFQIVLFYLAHVVYNKLDRCEFIHRNPKVIVKKVGTIWTADDYSEIRVYSGQNRIIAAERPA